MAAREEARRGYPFRHRCSSWHWWIVLLIEGHGGQLVTLCIRNLNCQQCGDQKQETYATRSHAVVVSTVAS